MSSILLYGRKVRHGASLQHRALCEVGDEYERQVYESECAKNPKGLLLYIWIMFFWQELMCKVNLTSSNHGGGGGGRCSYVDR